MIRIFTVLASILLLSGTVISQTQKDTIFNKISKIPVIIDGQATEECWTNAEWHAIDQVWMPFGATMKTGDFAGKFKVSWDENYLYLLVEVVDDSLSDDHSNPTTNWWDDDCLEIFIDENRSMGNHECNNNAFAYHVSLFYDAIDLSPSCGGINYKNHVHVKMDTIADNTYLWEMAFKIYSASYNNSNPEASRVTLATNKLMGLTVAYCDNDETTSRENFIGSMKMTASTNNEMYKNADYFGPMKLIDPSLVGITPDKNPKQASILVYPVPAQNWLNIEVANTGTMQNSATIYSISGQIIKSESFSGKTHSIDLTGLKAGMYLIEVNVNDYRYSKLFIKQ